MRRAVLGAFTGLVLFSVGALAWQRSEAARQGAKPATKAQAPAGVAGVDAGPGGGGSESTLATLFARDPLSHCYSFARAAEGSRIQDHVVKNAGADLDFGGYTPGCFTVGIEGGRVGRIVDLGSVEDLKARYGYTETVGGGQGFASIRRRDGAFVILQDYKSQATQELREAVELYPPGPDEKRVEMNHAPVVEGHVYLARISDDRGSNETIVKFLVVAHQPNQSVTIRWARID